MSLYNYVNRVLIGDGSNSAATSLPGIAKGDLFLLKEDGTVITTVATAQALPKFERVRIAMGVGPGLAILSSPIQGNTVSKYEGKAYVAPSEQVAIIGFNGTAGTGITIDASTEYRLRILIKDRLRIQGMRSTIADFNYVGGSAATAKEAAATIAKMFDQKDQGHRFLDGKIKLERTADGAFTATGIGVTIAVTEGSKKIVFGAAHTFIAGDVIRFGTTTTSPVYVIASVDGLNAYLDVAYKGVTETVAVGAAGELAGSTEWGFKLSALSQDSKVNRSANEPFDEYEWLIFDAVFSEAEDREIETAAKYTLVTAANPGKGYWKQIADREEKAKGYLGDTSKGRIYDKRINSNVVVDQAYDSIVITHADVHKGDFQGEYAAPVLTEIYVPNGSNQADETPASNQLVGILNGFFSDVLGFPALTF